MDKPRVGVGVWVLKDGKVLLGKRRKIGFGENTWCPPGGAVEPGEPAELAAKRETKEETGLDLEKTQFMTYVDDIFDQHWLTLYFVANWNGGIPVTTEQEIGDWGWFDWNALPEPLYNPTRNFVKSGYNPFNL